MLAFHSPLSLRHAPDDYFRRGTMIDHPEQAERYRILHDAVTAAGHRLAEAKPQPLDAVLAVHDRDYVDFLATAWARRDEVPGTSKSILPSHFARPQMSVKPESLLGLVGYYMADTSTPIQGGTWEAVKASADVAIEAANAVAVGAPCAYALCRPPGHHAYADSAGGFCFLNNSAIAAQTLLATYRDRVAILDIDVHHGNGTQGIFYRRSDVVTVSIHADPSNYFPFYTGYADEPGEDGGVGFNLNLPLAHGSGDGVYHQAIHDGLAAIKAHSPQALVIALGLDASEHDPIGALKVTTKGFEEAGRIIAQAGLPTVIVQEGGYLCEALPHNLVAFLKGFESVVKP